MKIRLRPVTPPADWFVDDGTLLRDLYDYENACYDRLNARMLAPGVIGVVNYNSFVDEVTRVITKEPDV